MKYLVIFLAMLVLAYVLSRPDQSPQHEQKLEIERTIAEHRVTQGMSAGDVLRSLGESAVQTSTPDGRIIWGYKSGQYVIFTVNGVVGTGTLGKDGQPYFTGKDALKLR